MRGKKELTGKSILVKLTVAMILLSLISVTIILTVALNEQKQVMENNLIEDNKRIAEVAARSIEAGYIAQTLPFRTLNQINASEDILFWWIVNPEGEIYLADNPEMCGKRIGITSYNAVVEDYVYNGEDIKFLVQPLEIGEPGKTEALCIGISLKSVREATDKLILNGMLYFFAIAGFACLLSLFLARRFTGPITQLVEGTKAISRGEFDHRVAIETGDEIEELGNSFNEMAERVKKSIAEERIARSETENIMNTMINSLIVVDQGGNIIKANKAAFDLLGYSEAELIGMPFDKIIGPKDKEDGGGSELEKLIKEETDSVANFETTYIAKDGREIPVNFSASVMRDEEGRLKGIVCDGGDITEKKRAEEELRRSEERYRLLIENSAVCYGILQEGKVKYANPEAERLFGYSREEMQSEDFNFLEAFFPPDVRERVRENLRRRAAGEKLPDYEILMWNKNHEQRYVIVRNRAIEYEGRPAWEIQLVDITERKRAEERINQYVKWLEQFNHLAVDREMRMIELKREVNELCDRVGEKPRYDLSFVEGDKNAT